MDSLTNHTCMNLVPIVPATCRSFTSFLLQKCFHMERFGLKRRACLDGSIQNCDIWCSNVKIFGTALLKGKVWDLFLLLFCLPINTKTSWINVTILWQQVIIYCFSLPCQKQFSQKKKFFYIGYKTFNRTS